jgi:proteasome lid subunit RPN8/RPN11
VLEELENRRKNNVLKQSMHNPIFLKKQFARIKKESRRLAALNGTEICGLILDNGAFWELVQVRNKSRREGGFSFYSDEVRTIMKLAPMIEHEIVGTFHSHPVGLPEPGPADLSNAVDDSMMLIIDIIGRSARLWHVKDMKAKALTFRLI